MRPEVTRLRGNYETRRKNRVLFPDEWCSRCGMHVSEHNHRWGKGLMQLHHVKPISECVDEGILDPEVVNSKENVDSLCYFCHREYHTFAEPLGVPYLEWKAQRPVFDQMGRQSLGTSLDKPEDKFRRKAR
jgi:predicted HNH restriction endonuclease